MNKKFLTGFICGMAVMSIVMLGAFSATIVKNQKEIIANQTKLSKLLIPETDTLDDPQAHDAP